ncbi:MAG TPA: hypothetical protein VH740_15085 [Vicinamibacterales bacterium]
MISKPVVLGLLAAACVTAAAGGAYVAVRQNDSDLKFPVATSQPAPPPASPAVAETEAIVSKPAAVSPQLAPAASAPREKKSEPAPSIEPSSRKSSTPTSSVARASRPEIDRTPARTPSRSPEPAAEAAPSAERTAPAREPVSSSAPTASPVQSIPEPVVSDPPSPPARQFVEVVVPASSVLGLKVETPISSETARVEDRVEARLTRDVMADGRIAIPAGARVIGDVTEVDRGGKMKGKARLGVRFHTIVLDGTQVSLRTDPIFREGQSPGAESARKIGGAAIGGAVLGAIMGGAKGAAIGGATGAAGGSAVVMAGDRNAAMLPAGTTITVRLSSPVTVDVEKDPH